MGRSVMLTGASGALGPHIVRELLRDGGVDRVVLLLRGTHQDALRRFTQLERGLRALGATGDVGAADRTTQIIPIAGDVRHSSLGLDSHVARDILGEVDVVIHAAADTRFAAPLFDLHETNVNGTRNVLCFARQRSSLRQFVLVSTTCVAGTRTGAITERIDAEPPAFVNNYERTKWQAEQLVAQAALPSCVVRVSTCLGGEETGYVHRFGAIHHTLRWLARGLVPLVPGSMLSRVDVIGSDGAARLIAKAATRTAERLHVCHAAAGCQAVPLVELLACAVEHLRAQHPAWNRAQIEPPVLVDGPTFEHFVRSATYSRDPLFARVLEATSSFLPAFLHPKLYETVQAESLWGGPLPISDWRSTLPKVLDFGGAHDWGCSRSGD